METILELKPSRKERLFIKSLQALLVMMLTCFAQIYQQWATSDILRIFIMDSPKYMQMRMKSASDSWELMQTQKT